MIDTIQTTTEKIEDTVGATVRIPSPEEYVLNNLNNKSFLLRVRNIYENNARFDPRRDARAAWSVALRRFNEAIDRHGVAL